MKRPTLLYALVLLLEAPRLLAQPSPAALAAFNAYTQAVESRLAQQHRNPTTFLTPEPLHPTDITIDRLTPPSADLSGALLHHWRGTAFAPSATASDFNRLIRDFNAYPQHFGPQVLESHAVTPPSGPTQAFLRIRQHHVLTVVMDTSYDVTFAQLDPAHGYSISRSTHIDELDSANHPLPPAQDHGFLWRLNSYWSYEERDGGLYLQLEAVSLTRNIPRGLAWAVGPYIESIPRESLEFTLRSAVNAIRK
jgi:hypothetical protein